jgi:hypothetical protein
LRWYAYHPKFEATSARIRRIVFIASILKVNETLVLQVKVK